MHPVSIQSIAENYEPTWHDGTLLKGSYALSAELASLPYYRPTKNP